MLNAKLIVTAIGSPSGTATTMIVTATIKKSSMLFALSIAFAGFPIAKATYDNPIAATNGPKTATIFLSFSFPLISNTPVITAVTSKNVIVPVLTLLAKHPK